MKAFLEILIYLFILLVFYVFQCSMLHSYTSIWFKIVILVNQVVLVCYPLFERIEWREFGEGVQR